MLNKTAHRLLVVVTSIYCIGFIIEVIAIVYIAMFIYGLQNSILL